MSGCQIRCVQQIITHHPMHPLPLPNLGMAVSDRCFELDYVVRLGFRSRLLCIYPRIHLRSDVLKNYLNWMNIRSCYSNGLDHQGSILLMARIFSLLHCIQTDSGIHKVMRTCSKFSVSNATVSVKLITHPCLVPRSRMLKLYLHSTMSSYHSA
jgi:hypothetical protein